MATILLSAAGAAIGSSIGGSVLGLSMTAVGRFIGASIGRALDQRLLGQGAEAVEIGRMERFRLSGAGEGAPIAQIYGRMRVGGHVIWSTEFKERVKEKGGGGKGSPTEPKVKKYTYSVSLALALCEGEISGVNRVWADGAEIPVGDLNMRVYRGTADQLPDPKMEAVEGVGQVPAYRGTAYVVIEDMRLSRYGNRVPQFSFEVTRPDLRDADDLGTQVKAVAMIPGTGEYALSTKPVYMRHKAGSDKIFGVGKGGKAVANVNSPSEEPDFVTSLSQLQDEAPNCGAASLIVSWFGDDLRCGSCTIRPKVEQAEYEAKKYIWGVSGLTRTTAQTVPQVDNRPVYGGTPDDLSVIQAIEKMNEDGMKVMYYPFILMDQLDGNAKPDPYGEASEQARLPWRGRITLDTVPGGAGSTDGTSGADAAVAAFFGTASASDFSVGGNSVSYSGPDEWRYRRFILHQAALCAAAGGVDSFCIGSEMRGLTQIRGANGFAAVTALQALAAECRAILGPNVKIGYAADWSEYFGYHPQDGTGDVYFHLDPLWADANIDFIGIDNYMPLSDWRDGADHADASWTSIHSEDYLRANIEGGEGYDWYYASSSDRDTQLRSPITDGAHNEPWVFRYKDIRNWWDQPHHNRISGVRQATPTAWVPRSKPVWFTELGCAAVDKGTNQPNKFVDPKSSESSLPHYSNGLRDEYLQRQYLRAMLGYWSETANNPISDVYGGPMLDMGRAFIWAWDARPYPWFPGQEDLWSDGPNYRQGHWLNGRLSARSLASVVSEICERAGLMQIDVTGLTGLVRGYAVPNVSDARRALQPLMLAYGFDAIERDGTLVFQMRRNQVAQEISLEDLALSDEIEGDLSQTRAGEAEMSGRVRVSFVQAEADHQIASEEAVLPDDTTQAVSSTDLPLAMTRGEARQTAERWLSEARIARDTLRFALPPSKLALGAGDVVRVNTPEAQTLVRIDRVEMMAEQIIDAVRVEPDVFLPSDMPESAAPLRSFTAATPVVPLFLDLPLISGDEVPHAPYLAVTATPWPGSIAVYDAAQDADFALNTVLPGQSVIGVTETDLVAAPAGVMDRGPAVHVHLASGALQSVSDDGLLAGANVVAIGDGSPDRWELFQFRDATLLSEDRWALSNRLRGQAGSDGIMPDVWPAGSYVVMLDGAPEQISMAAALRGTQRHFRIGPSNRAVDDPSYEYEVHSFAGNGLRPYRPAHLSAETNGSDLDVTWIRRSRIDADLWESNDVPMGEEREAYVVRVTQNGDTLRETEVTSPTWTYSAGQRSADGVVGAYQIEVAQISARFGAGPAATLGVGA